MLDGKAAIGGNWKALHSYASRTGEELFHSIKKKSDPDANWHSMNYCTPAHRSSEPHALVTAQFSQEVAINADIFHISSLYPCPTIFLPPWLSFSLSQLCDRLTWGYKWHEFLSIIPPPFPLPFFLPSAVEIKDCWAKGKKDSINLRLSLTVTFTWQSCTALCEMRSLPAKALAYAPEILFLSLY